MLAAMKPMAGPAIYAVNPWTPGNPGEGIRHQLLNDDERAHLAKIASIVRFKKGDHIYDIGEEANSAFNIITGVVAAYCASDGGEHIAAFLHSGHLFGLSEEGRYINATRAVTSVVAYKVPLPAVRRLMDSHADLDLVILIKLCEELRAAQRHAMVLAQKHAVIRLAMFLEMQEQLQFSRREQTVEIYLPMDRSSIASYLGLTLAGVSRAFRTLALKKIISVRDRRHIKILNRQAFNKLADLR